MAAAELMLSGHVGVLRTVPPPEPDRLKRLQLTAQALRVEWPEGVSYQAFVRGLSPFVARQAALLVEAAGLLRGSGYVSFDGDAPSDPLHSPLASTYTHTTAPMAATGGRAGQYEAGIVSIVEAAILEPRVGETFEAIVVELHTRRGGATVALREPAVTARCTGDDLPLGGRIRVRLTDADVMQRVVRFEPA